MTVKFIHLRVTEFDGSAYRLASQGGMTIAYKRLSNGDTRIGVALCCERDHYNTKMGRIKAEGRMLSNNPKWAKTLRGDVSIDRIHLVGKILGINLLPSGKEWNSRKWTTKHGLERLNQV